MYVCMYVYIYIYTIHNCHILPPTEIDSGLCWADFTDSEGKHLFHRIG